MPSSSLITATLYSTSPILIVLSSIDVTLPTTTQSASATRTKMGGGGAILAGAAVVEMISATVAKNAPVNRLAMSCTSMFRIIHREDDADTSEVCTLTSPPHKSPTPRGDLSLPSLRANAPVGTSRPRRRGA